MREGDARQFAAVIALTILVGAAAYAGDGVKASVRIPSGQPLPIVTENGNAYAQGTYAVGTVQLLYTVNAYEFPAGSFASFDLSMAIGTYKPNRATGYPATVLLDQIGSTDIVLAPETTLFSVGGSSWTQTTRVQISISADAPDAGGTTLVGNLRIAADKHLDTLTNVQVKILLVHPAACVRFHHADDLLVVNTCGAGQTLDIGMALNPRFATNKSGSPGNAVFTYSKTGAMGTRTFNTLTLGTGPPRSGDDGAGAAVPFAEIIDRMAAAHSVDPRLIRAMIEVESAYRPRARSPRGAMGLMQLTPALVRRYEVADPYEPAANIEAGVRHLKSLLARYAIPLALAAYNAGETAVERFGGIPPYRETQQYVRRVLTAARLTAPSR